MNQHYVAWLRAQIEAATPATLHLNILPHVEDLAAMYRREMQQATTPGLKTYFQRTLAGLEDLLIQHQYHAAAA